MIHFLNNGLFYLLKGCRYFLLSFKTVEEPLKTMTIVSTENETEARIDSTIFDSYELCNKGIKRQLAIPLVLGKEIEMEEYRIRHQAYCRP